MSFFLSFQLHLIVLIRGWSIELSHMITGCCMRVEVLPWSLVSDDAVVL